MQKCVRYLEEFYSDYLLPELIDPCLTGNMDLRTELVQEEDTSFGLDQEGVSTLLETKFASPQRKVIFHPIK